MAIVAAHRRPEADCVAPLLDLAQFPPAAAARIAKTARGLVAGLRRTKLEGAVEGLIHEYDLSSQEGVALMCLAEALLRVPDAATRDALIRDKIAPGDWRAHLGHSPSPFVNAATWGLLVTGKLTATASESGLSAALTRLVGRGGEPLIRRGVDLAIRLMGEKFVTGQTIAEALRRARRMEARGFTYSYDMLGEAAVTAEDAGRYHASYEEAIHAIGRASAQRGPYAGPGISIKLSALHPRYVRAKRMRVLNELLPRARALALLAKSYDIGLNIDAEEADRLDLSLDILEALAGDPELSGWNGLGFVVQAYGKRCPFVIDWLVDLGRRTRRRLMVRLVKGAYWDSEIKRAQADGLDDFPVFTRKVHTDVSYLACARMLLDAPDAVFPQFATHNAQTLASIVELGGPDFQPGQYEFQCLHGMGEPLYAAVVGAGALDRPCRIYAPVGTHETLLAYLVRRLLENGANSSFVRRIADGAVPLEDLIADPVAEVRAMPEPGAPHPQITRPRDLFGSARANSAGLDLGDEAVLARLAVTLPVGSRVEWTAVPSGRSKRDAAEPVRNPADREDVVGHVCCAEAADIADALAAAEAAAPRWGATPVSVRADTLRRAADAMEARMPILLGLIVLEAGRTLANAVSEVREAVDFLRYYAGEAERLCSPGGGRPLGPIACISPWNFPLAIFIGQVAAALAAGNTVLAKPAEETPLVAAEAVRLMIEAGIPADVLHLAPGAGEAGAALVDDTRVQGVIFTGSTAVARLIQRTLANRLTADGRPVPFIAETGGQNAMIVDSSALPEQVVGDVIASAFDSAGQRCSALRILCLQEEIADRTLALLHGALRELEVGDPRRLSVDIGPVINVAAAEGITHHIETMRSRGHKVTQWGETPEMGRGTFVAPTVIEIGKISEVEAEVFGPVLHVLRYRRDELDALIDTINATGYGLTFGLHTRIEETVARVLDRIEAGNVYVNRNTIGAVVGVQPFGGSGLSGTGPKAGGPRYLRRLLTRPAPCEASVTSAPSPADKVARDYVRWLRKRGYAGVAARVEGYRGRMLASMERELPGPVGERNSYSLRARGRIAALASSEAGTLLQIGAILATGQTAVIAAARASSGLFAGLPAAVRRMIVPAEDPAAALDLGGVLHEGGRADLTGLLRRIAQRSGPILTVHSIPTATNPDEDYDPTDLCEERSVSINTAAAGGNASLMALDA